MYKVQFKEKYNILNSYLFIISQVITIYENLME